MEGVLVRKVILGIAAKQVSKQIRYRYDWIYEKGVTDQVNVFTQNEPHTLILTLKGLKITPS